MIPIAKPVMDEREADAARRPILSGWVTQGPEVKAFEDEFATFVGAPHACAVSNCTSALHLALLAVGVKPGGEVITVSHSFIATANSVKYCGAEPVFVDIRPDTFNLDPDKLEAAVTERTQAILCVHQMGMPCDLERIVAMGRKYRLPVVEDAACAAGSQIFWQGQWERIGKPHGDIACFSFHPRKVITTGDGGMLTTARPDWDAQFRLMRQHGMSVPDAARHGARSVIIESYERVAFNYRMTDIQAAVGRVQLQRLPDLVRRRRELAANYRALLASIPGLAAPVEPEWARSNWQSYCVRLPGGCEQRRVMQSLLDREIATRRGVMNAHAEPAYVKHSNRFPLPESEAAQRECLILPLYHDMTDFDQQHVCESLRNCLMAIRSITGQAD